MRPVLIRTIAVLLILVVQIQPLQVHAIVLVTEQAGHMPGLLFHSHGSQHHHFTAQDEESQAMDSSISQLSQEPVHAGECHPAHTLCTLIEWRANLERNLSGVQVHPAPALPFYEASLELPPPKYYA
ncbi:hypothetical protein QKW35_05245 [Pontibacterium granulatum]|uniref:hypothetical protein n=1 Tax=Pontibacterium granulatum TaxID=2036029 RepID=UPI00249C9189|nr:hypothetical protein [Pontibacterium granulatum]MDI3323780.1 hypothetical protein [Pontibacterium granulatum]